MTPNQAKAEELLKSIRKKTREYKSTLLEIEALEYAASGMGAIRYDKDKVDGGKTSDKLATFSIDVVEKKAECEELLAECEELKITCYHIIRLMEDPDERVLLEWLYINAKDMSDVISRLCVSERKAYNIREDALEHFGEKM